MISILTCLWEIIANDNMINIKHTKHYRIKMRSNKVKCSTAAELYFTPFFMPKFSSIKIILHHFNVDNYKGKLVIGYEMIIGHDLMVQLGLFTDFKRQVI